MTAVEVWADVETGEVVTVLDVEAARYLSDQIALGLADTWQLVRQAYEGRAWIALGYGNWDDYCDQEFGNTYIRLPREDRQEAVKSLRDHGMSIRAIAAATGSSPTTVQSDLDQVYQSGTPDGADEVEPAGDDAEPAGGESATPPPTAPPKTTGLDGKKYERTSGKRQVDPIQKSGDGKKKTHDPSAEIIAHNRIHDPETRRRWINAEVRGFLMSTARELIDQFEANEAAGTIGKTETVMALTDAYDLRAWLDLFIETIESPGATIHAIGGDQ